MEEIKENTNKWKDSPPPKKKKENCHDKES